MLAAPAPIPKWETFWGSKSTVQPGGGELSWLDFGLSIACSRPGHQATALKEEPIKTPAAERWLVVVTF